MLLGHARDRTNHEDCAFLNRVGCLCFELKTRIEREVRRRNSKEVVSLIFAARNKLNDDYGVLIAKYYCWDPYYGIGMEITGGSYCGSVSGGNNGGARPNSQGWYLPIAAAKELSDGEIVPSGFFQKSRRI